MSLPSFSAAFRRLFVVRLVGTVSLRFAYPFLPGIADGLGVSIGAVGLALAAGEGAGLLAPLVGRRLDRIGRRRGMTDGLVIGALGCTIAAAAPGAVAFGVGLFAVAVGRAFFDISMGAWIGDEVEFARRGRASGIGELAWSGAFLLGVPVAGLVMSTTTWRVPYLLSAVVMLASIPVVRATLDTRTPQAVAGAPAAAHARPTLLHAVVFCTSLGAGLLLVTEGAWFELDLGLTERAISGVVVLLGIGEVVGALLAAGLADRVGKRITMIAGLIVLVPAAVAMGLIESSQVAGVAAAFVVGLGFELAFVSALPLVVEVSEERRAGSLSLAIASLTGARTVAAIVGTAVFEASGMGAVAVLSVPALLAGLLVVTTSVREPAAATPVGAPS
jgi:predicted MFS family arabinose efflux permease